MSYYQKMIQRLSPEAVDPRHIEAFMRLRYSTLDGLDSKTFKIEVMQCANTVIEMGYEGAEKLAKSYSL